MAMRVCKHKRVVVLTSLFRTVIKGLGFFSEICAAGRIKAGTLLYSIYFKWPFEKPVPFPTAFAKHLAR